MEDKALKHQTEVANRQFALGTSLLAILPMVVCSFLEIGLQHMLLVGSVCAFVTLVISFLAPPVSMGDEFNTTAFMIFVPYAAALLSLMLFDVDRISIILALTIALSINSAAILVHILHAWAEHPRTMFR